MTRSSRGPVVSPLTSQLHLHPSRSTFAPYLIHASHRLCCISELPDSKMCCVFYLSDIGMQAARAYLRTLPRVHGPLVYILVRRSSLSSKHSDPVFAIRWIDADSDRGEGIATISTDGKVVHWNIAKGLEHTGPRWRPPLAQNATSLPSPALSHARAHSTVRPGDSCSPPVSVMNCCDSERTCGGAPFHVGTDVLVTPRFGESSCCEDGGGLGPSEPPPLSSGACHEKPLPFATESHSATLLFHWTHHIALSNGCVLRRVRAVRGHRGAWPSSPLPPARRLNEAAPCGGLCAQDHPEAGPCLPHGQRDICSRPSAGRARPRSAPTFPFAAQWGLGETANLGYHYRVHLAGRGWGVVSGG